MNPTFGQKLKTVRVLRGIYQKELAQRSGVQRYQIIALERGDNLVPGHDIRARLETALDLDFDAPEVEAAFCLLAGLPAQAVQILHTR